MDVAKTEMMTDAEVWNCILVILMNTRQSWVSLAKNDVVAHVPQWLYV